jgi:hypothetical protein
MEKCSQSVVQNFHHGAIYTNYLLKLARMLAAHSGRSEVTVAKWCGVHARLFTRMAGGHGCRVDTYNLALRAFADRWPADLEWPADIPRPPRKSEAA